MHGPGSTIVKPQHLQRAREFVDPFRDLRLNVHSQKWDALYQGISAAIGRGDSGFLVALVTELDEDTFWTALKMAWRGLGLVQHPDAVITFLENTKRPPRYELRADDRCRPPDGVARQMGAMLAYGHDDTMLEHCLEVFSGDPEAQNLLACWVQERVIRGTDFTTSSDTQRFWDNLRPSDRPLATATLGGAYTKAQSAAYGRLFMWRSLAAIIGDEAQKSPEELAAIVEETDWAFFTADTDWFCQVCIDVGLLALRRDRSTLLVFAGTDTD